MGIDSIDPKTGFQLPRENWDLIPIPKPSRALLNSFNRLVADPYAKNCNRFRRFAQFKAQHGLIKCLEPGEDHDWKFERLPLRPFIQSYEDNKLSGGIPRYFKPIRADFTPLLSHILGMETSNKAYQIDVNQYRVTAEGESEGVPVPEGIHRDGRPIVVVAVYNRRNIEGAELSLYPNDSDVAFATMIVQPGYAAIFNDNAMRHNVTSIKATVKNVTGLRDYVAVNCTPWDERRYGPAYEASILAPGQVVDETKVQPFGKFEFC